jgi:hypothetical protein
MKEANGDSHAVERLDLGSPFSAATPVFDIYDSSFVMQQQKTAQTSGGMNFR